MQKFVTVRPADLIEINYQIREGIKEPLNRRRCVNVPFFNKHFLGRREDHSDVPLQAVDVTLGT